MSVTGVIAVGCRVLPSLTLSLSVAVVHCSEPPPPCPDITPSGPTIVLTVTDAATGADVCDANIIATDGQVSNVLSLNATADASCDYYVDYTNPGTYAVRASAPGYQENDALTIIVPADGCGYGTMVDSSIKLTAAP